MSPIGHEVGIANNKTPRLVDGYDFQNWKNLWITWLKSYDFQCWQVIDFGNFALPAHKDPRIGVLKMSMDKRRTTKHACSSTTPYLMKTCKSSYLALLLRKSGLPLTPFTWKAQI